MLNVWAGCVWIKSAAACRPPGAAVTQTSGNIRSSHCKRCTWSGSCNVCEVDASAAPRAIRVSRPALKMNRPAHAQRNVPFV